MVRFSQNGWPAYPDTRRYTRFTAAGQGWWAANADVAVVFTEFIERFAREVESITGPVLDDWSYANRLVRGSATVVSNHGSATAIDINALRHGRGRHGTFTPAKAKKTRAIRDSITDAAGRPVLRLGMDFNTIPDDMHVEICAGARAVRQAADKIRARKKAQEDEMTPAQLKEFKAAVIDGVADEVMRRLREVPAVDNLPLAKGGPQGADWTFAGVLAADDRKLDLLRGEVAEVAAALGVKAKP
jgi:hypothetical protein